MKDLQFPTRASSTRNPLRLATGAARWGLIETLEHRVVLSAAPAIDPPEISTFTTLATSSSGQTSTPAERAAAKVAKAAKAAKEAKEAKARKLEASAPQSLNWVFEADGPVVRDEAGTATVGDNLFVFGGYSDYVWTAVNRVDVYNVKTNVWTQLRDMPKPLNHVAMAVQGTKVWMMGGYLGENPGPSVRDVYIYDTVTDTYTAGPSLPEERGAGAASIVGNKLVYFGGTDNGPNDTRNDKGTTWTLDLGNSSGGWTRVAKLPNNRNHLGAVTIGGDIYAVGGQHSDQTTSDVLADVHRYNPKLDRWTAVASLPGVTSHILAATLAYDGHILVVGGEYKHGYGRDTIYAYDPDLNAWETFANLPTARRATVATIVDDKLYSTTGSYNVGVQSRDTIETTLPPSL
jgi:N-acetylneuraminic acid mutarotase